MDVGRAVIILEDRVQNEVVGDELEAVQVAIAELQKPGKDNSDVTRQILERIQDELLNVGNYKMSGAFKMGLACGLSKASEIIEEMGVLE